MRASVIALLCWGAAATAHAQAPIHFGTDPNASYEPYFLAVDPAIPRIYQHITTPTSVMLYRFLTVGVWVDPTEAMSEWGKLYFVFNSNASEWGEIFSVQSRHVGWHYFTAAIEGRLLPGTELSFGLASSGNLDYHELCWEPAEPAAECPADPGRYRTYRSSADAYPDGYGMADDDATGDLMFRGVWHNGETVAPEPFSIVLLATGLLGVGAAARRRSIRSLTRANATTDDV